VKWIWLLALSGLVACMIPTGFGITVVQPPPIVDDPHPEPFEGEEDPELEASPVEGLFHAPAVHEHLYYYAPDDLWYRYWKQTWFQAFLWNGGWYPPRRVPEALYRVQPPPEGIEPSSP
jgi:hypothetical protein